MLQLHVIASGSSGNAAIVQDSAAGTAFLIDCGICKRDLIAGCEGAGVDPASLTDILITHDHSDHTKGLGVAVRGLAKLGVHLTIHASSAVREASKPLEEALGEEAVAFRPFRAGDALSGGSMQGHVFRTSHDAAESFGFRVEGEGEAGAADALGYLTDTGCVTPEAHDALQGVRLLALEANHDVSMLREGPYPYLLKQRILSDRGHLSNDQATAELELLLSCPGATALEQVVAMHVSRENNLYMQAQEALACVLMQHQPPASALVAKQKTPISLS